MLCYVYVCSIVYMHLKQAYIIYLHRKWSYTGVFLMRFLWLVVVLHYWKCWLFWRMCLAKCRLVFWWEPGSFLGIAFVEAMNAQKKRKREGTDRDTVSGPLCSWFVHNLILFNLSHEQYFLAPPPGRSPGPGPVAGDWGLINIPPLQGQQGLRLEVLKTRSPS